ncbi:MAG: hypothetical protein HC859_15280 [Bacteroidia bacterium]|nr:hypothetical protein [Bacteroidia bacterium]
MIGAVVLLTVVSTLDRFWFLAGMGLFILFVVSLRLEVLSLFGQRNIIPTIVVLVVYVGTSFFSTR